MIEISLKNQKIHIQNTNPDHTEEYGNIIEICDRFYKIEMIPSAAFIAKWKSYHNRHPGTWTRSFSKKTGRAVGKRGAGPNGLKILP